MHKMPFKLHTETKQTNKQFFWQYLGQMQRTEVNMHFSSSDSARSSWKTMTYKTIKGRLWMQKNFLFSYALQLLCFLNRNEFWLYLEHFLDVWYWVCMWFSWLSLYGCIICVGYLYNLSLQYGRRSSMSHVKIQKQNKDICFCQIHLIKG